MRTKTTRLFWLAFAALAVWKCFVAWRLDPCHDESYYFYWSLFPRLSYFDHPPLTAWAMAVSGKVWGDSIWTIRIWPLLAGLGFVLIGRSLARGIFSPEAGDRAGLLLLLSPVFIGNGLIMTPDVLFSLAWAAAAWVAWRALIGGRGRWLFWVLVGLVGGLGALAKYNMILFFFGLGLFWAMAPGRRWELVGGAAVSGVVALAVFLPVLIWNVQNDWASIRFQMGHGFAGRDTFWTTLPAYLGGLLLICTPGLGIQAFHSAAGAVRSKRWEERFLAAIFWMVVAFFGVSACRAKVGMNWPMLAFFTGAILVAGRWESYPRWTRRLTMGILWVFLAAGVGWVSGVAIGRDWMAQSGQVGVPRVAEFVGGRQLGAAVEKKQGEVNPASTNTAFVCVARYQVFGRLAFFAPALRDRLWLPMGGGRRFPWIDERQWLGRDALLVVKSEQEARKLAAWFETVEEAGDVGVASEVRGGKALRFYVGRGYRALETGAASGRPEAGE